MGRLDRREKLALDESYRYYLTLEAGEKPAVFRLTQSLRTLSTALAFPEHRDFKLTRQLWKRLQQFLFDRLITSFAGELSVHRQNGTRVLPGRPIPSDGYVRFRTDGCKRLDDIAELEVKHLYPKTLKGLSTAWMAGRSRVRPQNFDGINECDAGVCLMTPVVVGVDVLNEESRTSKDEAYRRFWDLYLQAYCTPRKHERAMIYKHMSQIESVWGDLYY